MALSDTAVGGGVALVAALFVATFGYLIRYREATSLIAGYQPDTVGDETAVARLVGGYVLLVAALTAAIGVGMLVVSLPESAWGRVWLGYGVVLVVGVLAMNRYAERYAAD